LSIFLPGFSLCLFGFSEGRHRAFQPEAVRDHNAALESLLVWRATRDNPGYRV